MGAASGSRHWSGRRTTRRGSLLAGAVAVAAAVPSVVAGGTAEATPSPRRTLLVLGDSWSAGLYADPAHALGQVAAAALGWRGRIDAVSGSGYLNTASVAADYVRRAAQVPRIGDGVVVVQGGSNDGSQDLGRLQAAVTATVETLRDRVDGAPVLLLGPGPDPQPVTAQQRHVDDLIAAAAVDLGVPYVSMLRQQWIPLSTSRRLIDPVNAHPTVAGQRYLGRRLADQVRARFPALTGGAVRAVDWEGPTARG